MGAERPNEEEGQYIPKVPTFYEGWYDWTEKEDHIAADEGAPKEGEWTDYTERAASQGQRPNGTIGPTMATCLTKSEMLTRIASGPRRSAATKDVIAARAARAVK